MHIPGAQPHDPEMCLLIKDRQLIRFAMLLLSTIGASISAVAAFVKQPFFEQFTLKPP
jgi:hypothetical protein